MVYINLALVSKLYSLSIQAAFTKYQSICIHPLFTQYLLSIQVSFCFGKLHSHTVLRQHAVDSDNMLLTLTMRC